MVSPRPLAYGQYYHIYNRGNNREDVFFEERNYAYFLELYARHIEAVAEIYAYCMLKNHLHLLVRINSEDEQAALATNIARPRSPSQAFGDLFNAYAKAINKARNRTGSLFQNPFGRSLVPDNTYLVGLIIYIHWNPQKHGLIGDFRHWPHSSYRTLLSSRPTRLKRDDVLAWFGDRQTFQAGHMREPEDPKPTFRTLTTE